MTDIIAAVGCVLYLGLAAHLYSLGRTVGATLVSGMAVGLVLCSVPWGWIA
ncbi:hypothetical protein [Streptomyces sp. B15]|uniref:hypothetical protein n=1 Tax=Streptomyces sp. B15 TaxID=1537797 RepID=UPI001B36C58E|nr:hypothetical protein [Streptomyces sp. B15]MBQ1122621.1 hypothetical protein [Streptomyces sp. B15]